MEHGADEDRTSRGPENEVARLLREEMEACERNRQAYVRAAEERDALRRLLVGDPNEKRIEPGWTVKFQGPLQYQSLEIIIAEPEDLALVRRWLERIEVTPPPARTVHSVPKSAPCPGCGSTAKGLHVRGCGDAGLIQPDYEPPAAEQDRAPRCICGRELEHVGACRQGPR